jgi:acetyl-CoA acetyltransferase
MPLRLLMCSPITDGSAAIVFSAYPPTARSRPLVEVRSCSISSYRPRRSVVTEAAGRALAAAGVSASECDVLQLHDACAFAELKQMEEIGLVPYGQAASSTLAGETGVGGSIPINTDGGLLSRGHPLGATGIAQIAELSMQLRGEAYGRQVNGARTAMAVNAGGWMGDDYAAAVVTVLTSECA